MILMPLKESGVGKGSMQRGKDWYVGGGYYMEDSCAHLSTIRMKLRGQFASRVLELADEHLREDDAKQLRTWLRSTSNYRFYDQNYIEQHVFERWLTGILTQLRGFIDDDPECQRLLSSQTIGITAEVAGRKVKVDGGLKRAWPSTRLDPGMRAWIQRDEATTRTRLHNERKVQAFRDGKCQSCFREPIKRDGKCQWCLKYEVRMAKRRPQC